jgi:hypothetical protein
MRIDPSEKAIRGNQPDLDAKARVDAITRIVAITVAFLSTFGLLVKILFF